jgi:orotate phosphoribosyltransferase
MTVKLSDGKGFTELVERHRRLYDSPMIDAKMSAIIRDAPQSKLSDWDVHRILRTSRSVMFDSHVEVVSGHHTATYMRFESIAAFPQLIRLIARDMADWIESQYTTGDLAGIIATASAAEVLAEAVADLVREHLRLSVVLTPFDHETGKIGTEVVTGAVREGERFLVLNDVTTRGNCVGKLGKVVTDHGGPVAGMLVFARRDSGQFPLVEQLMGQFPFYYTADLQMPQWEPSQCPLCKTDKPLISWKDVPELQP